MTDVMKVADEADRIVNGYAFTQFIALAGGFEPPVPEWYAALAMRCHRPLGHASE